MSSGLGLDLIKDHVQITFADHDALLQGYLTAAEQHVINYTRRDLDAEYPDGWPEPIKVALMYMVADYYAHGDDDADVAGIPAKSQLLLAHYRAYS